MVTCATADKPHLARRFCAVVLRYAPETFQLKADFPLMSGNVLRYRSSVVYNSTFLVERLSVRLSAASTSAIATSAQLPNIQNYGVENYP